MPIYEYRCAECGHELEKLQKISDAPLTECPACGKPALQKLVSAAGFRLKGGGWYETDFKSGEKKNIAKADSKSKTDTGSKPASKPSSTSGKKTG
ncbi:MAG TPA: zinc ribbon domain-containing protein [Gammaproteobacteria bacterium]|nr:zinc ribbon domain-containing protein [Gammaproteobacteria bacterium]